ncbi:MAG: MATE family efflux transporter [Clostridia bacterium]|nr:MATE family efflux transporter [Clostridia bacterium]
MKKSLASGAGASRELIEGPIWRGLLNFAFPIFLGNLFQQLYNTADTLIVGNFIDKQALAAVSSSGNLIFMIVGLLNGIAMGAGVVIAKFFGAKDEESMRRAIHTDIAFGLVGGLLLTAVGVAFTPHMLRWMGTPNDVLPNSILYFRTYFYGVLATFMYNIATGILHAVGDSKHPLYYLICASVINVILDLLFVAVFKWGIASAAAATVISQFISASLALRRLMTVNDSCRVNPREIRFDIPILKSIVRLGLPSGVQNSVIGFANVMVQKNINIFESDAMAGCGSYAKIEGFAFLPVTCFVMALSTFVSQNLGAKQIDRVKKGTKFGVLCSMSAAAVISVIVFTCAPFLLRLFNDDPAVIAFGVKQAHIQSLFYCLLAFSHCMAGILRGAGKAYVPMAIMLICWCLIRVTYITVTVNLFHEIGFVFSSYPITWSLSSIIFLIYYLKADWVHGFEKKKA